MKESRVFELNQVTAEQVLEAVTTFLRGEKGMEVQSVATPNGYLIQAAQADTLRTLSGMKLATTVELTVNGTQLNVTLGEGQWADKLGAGAVGIFLLWPLAVTAGIGAYKQKKLPSEIFEVVYRCTMGEPTSFRTSGRRAYPSMRRRQLRRGQSVRSAGRRSSQTRGFAALAAQSYKRCVRAAARR